MRDFIVGTMIKNLREKKEITQQELADSINVSRTRLSNIENNKTDPKPYEINDLCDYFGVSSDYLLGRVDYVAKNNAIDNLATLFNLSSRARENLQKVFKDHHYNFSNLNNYIEHGNIGELIEAISVLNYYNSIIEKGDKEREKIKKRSRGNHPSPEDVNKLIFFRKQTDRCLLLVNHYTDLLLQLIVNFVHEALKQEEYNEDETRLVVDVMNDDDFACQLTSVYKKQICYSYNLK